MQYYQSVTGGFADPSIRPNWVNSQTASPSHRADPIPFSGSLEQTRERLLQILTELPRTTVVAVSGDYLHAECRSRFWGFVDDVEFALDSGSRLIHFSSAARSGWSDFGVNRRRIEQVRRQFEATVQS